MDQTIVTSSPPCSLEGSDRLLERICLVDNPLCAPNQLASIGIDHLKPITLGISFMPFLLTLVAFFNRGPLKNFPEAVQRFAVCFMLDGHQRSEVLFCSDLLELERHDGTTSLTPRTDERSRLLVVCGLVKSA